MLADARTVERAVRGACPTLEMSCRETGQHLDVTDARVQRWNVVEALAPRGHERRTVADGDLFERLEVVRRKTGTDDGDALASLRCEFQQQLIRVGSQPFATPEARLKAQRPLACLEAERLSDQSRGFVTLAMVRITGEEVVARRAVKGKQQMLFAMCLPMPTNARRDRVDISSIVVILRDQTQLR